LIFFFLFLEKRKKQKTFPLNLQNDPSGR